MTFLCCLKNRNKFHDLLITRTKDTKILNFCLKLKKITPFLFLMLRFVEKKINLQQGFSEKIRSNFGSFVALEHKFGLVYTLIHRSFTIAF